MADTLYGKATWKQCLSYEESLFFQILISDHVKLYTQTDQYLI